MSARSEAPGSPDTLGSGLSPTDATVRIFDGVTGPNPSRLRASRMGAENGQEAKCQSFVAHVAILLLIWTARCDSLERNLARKDDHPDRSPTSTKMRNPLPINASRRTRVARLPYRLRSAGSSPILESSCRAFHESVETPLAISDLIFSSTGRS